MGETPTERGTRVPRVVLGVLGLAVLAWLLLTWSTLPGVRDAPGRDPLWDGWIQCGGYVLAASAAVLRATLRTHDRRLWSLLAGALALRAFAFVWSIYVLGLPPPYPSLADAGWLLSALLLAAALAVLVRVWMPRNSRTLVLDALLGGLAVAAVAVTVLYGTLVRLTAPGVPAGAVATNLAYPVLDVVLLTLVGGLLVSARGRVSGSVLALSLGIVLIAVVDCTFLYQASVGTFRPGSWLSPTSLAGTILVACAGWVRGHGGPRPDQPEQPAPLWVPVLLAATCVGVLLYGSEIETSPGGPLFAAGGVGVAILRAYLTLTDDRREATETIGAQQQEVERFRLLAEASGDFVAMADVRGWVIYVNPAGRRLVGLAPDHDVTTMQVRDFLPPEQHEAWLQERRQAALTGGDWEGEAWLKDFSGGPPIPVASRTFGMRNTDTGEVELIGSVQRDISARKRAEEERRRFSSLVDASADFIAIAAVDGSVLYVNPAGREMVGLAPDIDVTETSIVDYLTEEGIQASLEVEQPAVVLQGHWEGESTLRDLRGGPPTPVAINSFLMRHPDTGEPWLLATVQRDISERIAAEQGLRDLAEQRQVLLGHLVQAQEDERARIAADVHDDSVQALAAVELRLSMLQRALDGQAEQVATVEQLRETVGHATDRLRHLLFDLESPARRTDLRGALAEAAAYVLEDEVHWRIEGEGGSGLTTGGRVTAYRIAKEALVNVRKHAGAHRVVLGLHDRDGGVEVTVADDGRGFDPDAVADRPGHLGIQGMRDRAAVAGATLDYDAAPGRGTTLRLWLPLDGEADQEAAD